MKLLALSDIHGNLRALRRLLRSLSSSDIDLTLLAGDIAKESVVAFSKRILVKFRALSPIDLERQRERSRFEKSVQMKSVRSVLEEFLKLGRPLVCVTGNEDLPVVEEHIKRTQQNCKIVRYIHCTKEDFGGYAIVGFGGVSMKKPFSFDNPHVFPEEYLYGHLAELLQGEDPRKTILLLHELPSGVVRSSDPALAGSTAIRAILEEFHPLICICGHAHSQFAAQLGETLVVNPGALKHFEYAMIKIDDRISGKLARLPHSLLYSYEPIATQLYKVAYLAYCRQ